MRIGTWNLEGKWSPDHEAVLLHLNCDVLLLTEPPVVMEFGEGDVPWSGVVPAR